MSTVALSNTSANLSGKTAVLAEVDQTITGLQTFDRGIGAPFAVNLGAAVVPNLIAANADNAANAANAANADKLDGLDSTDFAKVATVPPLYAPKAWTFVEVALTGPTQVDNYAPGIVGHTIIQIDPATEPINLTGLQSTSPPFTGQLVQFVFTGGTHVTFFHENTNSLPANRFHLRSSAPVVIGGYWGGVAFQYYGGTLLGWLQVSPFQNGIGG